MGFGNIIFDKMSSKLNENGYPDIIHQWIWLQFIMISPVGIYKKIYFIDIALILTQ